MKAVAAIVAVVRPLIGLGVALGFFDVDTGTTVVQAIDRQSAHGLGVYEVANRAPAPEAQAGSLERRRDPEDPLGW